MVSVILTGWCHDRHLSVVVAALREQGLPAVKGDFHYDTFVAQQDSDPRSLAAIGAYFAPQTLAKQIAIYAAQIDAEADSVCAGLIGNRGSYYALAESEALAYKSAGYTGAVPASVQSWAAIKAQTATWAADNILAAAARTRAAEQALHASRLRHKELVRTASGFDVLDTTMASWRSALLTMK